MNDPLFVCGSKRFGNLLRDRERVINCERTLLDALGHGRPFNQLHHQRNDSSRSLETVDRRDVRVTQRSEDFRLALEARQPIGIGGHSLRQYRALQVGVGRAIDLAHTADADLGGHFKRAESTAG